MREDDNSGLPTRAVHEAYLDMHRALKRYRTARDKGTQAQIDDAHGDVQEAVLTFYEMLRPHLKDKENYWMGRLPPYNGDSPPDPDQATAVLQVQDHNQMMSWEDAPIDPEVSVEDLRKADLEQWHEHLNLNGSIRLKGVVPNEDGVFISSHRYQIGLRQMDSWITEYRTKQTELGGFLGSTKTEEKKRVRVNITKLKRAARELSDAAKEMGFLPEQDVQDNDDALPI